MNTATSTASPRLTKLVAAIKKVDLKLQQQGDYIPTNVDVTGFRFQRDEPILLVRYGRETLALRDESSYDEKDNLVPGFLDQNNNMVASASHGPLGMFVLGVQLYNLFMDEVDKLNGDQEKVAALVEEVKTALRQVSGYTG